MRAYTLEYPKNLQHYLAGKKIFTLGHSCSRRWYFELKELLGDEGVNLHMSRTQEVTEWGRGGVDHGWRSRQGASRRYVRLLGVF